ncbi:hypothetical protein CAEBREN_11051 [Caenorhabditis brenneri]|uniref:Smr domain-containing protein n=1 Tax=Caenorhabditis brenneri TaxID=135651 RepID=G0MCL1_CAEBE|nr:hypothetical protein CAEBREN_11051 [Caenorhabditis brenneri]
MQKHQCRNDREVSRRARQKMVSDVIKLYEQRKDPKTTRKEARAIEKKINKKVEDWNLVYGEAGYLDLHLMTLYGALSFVARMAARHKGHLYLETGVGNGSRDGVPVIKQSLLRKYEGNIKVCQNEGVLVLFVSQTW